MSFTANLVNSNSIAKVGEAFNELGAMGDDCKAGSGYTEDDAMDDLSENLHTTLSREAKEKVGAWRG